jgi:hypothetical protein
LRWSLPGTVLPIAAGGIEAADRACRFEHRSTSSKLQHGLARQTARAEAPENASGPL